MYACVIFYNDAPLLERCLRSLDGKFEKIIAVDGAFKEFPHHEPFSTDGSIEVARNYGCKLIKTDEAWETQVDKRNRYIQEVPDWESFLVIDADEEFLSGTLRDGNWKVKIKAIADGGIEYYWPRVFVKTPGFEYHKTHMTYKDDSGLINTDRFPESDIEIAHYTQDRDEKRVADKEIYRRIHNERELKDREILIREMQGESK